MHQDLNKLSQVFLTGPQETTCGYCKSDRSQSFGLWAAKLAVDDYQALIDRNWRRSGKFLYKPTNHATCCPLYTIRLEASRFQLSQSQKKVLKQFRNKTKSEGRPANHCDGNEGSSKTDASPGLRHSIDDLGAHFRLIEVQGGRLQITLEPAAYDDESFELYQRYQTTIHEDDESKVTVKGYKRFLVDSPLCSDNDNFGTFHMKYRLDGHLICIGVLDILPRCLSSVYLFYDPDYAHLSLGNYSALREIWLTQDLSHRVPSIKYYYMGYYIHTCPKMRYKASYRPSELLDPHSFTWVPVDVCMARLEETAYTCLLQCAAPEVNRDKGAEDVDEADILVLVDSTVMTMKYIRRIGLLDEDENMCTAIRQYASLVGRELTTRMLLRIQ